MMVHDFLAAFRSLDYGQREPPHSIVHDVPAVRRLRFAELKTPWYPFIKAEDHALRCVDTCFD